MYLFLTVLIILSAILLSGIVLIQSSKGGGLAAGLSSSNQVMGVRKTTEGLEKLTWGFGAGLMLLVLLATSQLPSTTTEATTAAPAQKTSTTLERASKTATKPGAGQQQGAETQPASTAQQPAK